MKLILSFKFISINKIYIFNLEDNNHLLLKLVYNNYLASITREEEIPLSLS